MYRKIVVGYRRGERGTDALALARVLASVGQVEDVLIVEALPSSRAHHEDEDGHSGDAAERLAGLTEGWPPGPRVVAHTEYGESASDTLAGVAEREGADLVVLGSTHRGFAGRVLIGTTAGALLPDAAWPVAVAPSGYAGKPAPLHEIAVAFDGSTEARAALDWAAGLAAAVSAHLRLVAVVTPPPPVDTWAASVPGEAWSSGLSYPGTAEAVDAMRERMERELEAAAASAGCSTAATATVVGDPERELHAAAEHADMLVVGSHRRGALSGVLFGSVSRGLAHSCPAPLVVVPAAPHDGERPA